MWQNKYLLEIEVFQWVAGHMEFFESLNMYRLVKRSSEYPEPAPNLFLPKPIFYLP